MTQPVSVAQYFPWDGGAVFLGTSGVVPAHAHQAIQICFLFEGRIRLCTGAGNVWSEYDVAIVPSQHRHAMDALGTQPGATLFIEPETREGRSLTQRYLSAGPANVDRTPFAASFAALHAAFRDRQPGAVLLERARDIVRSLTRPAESDAGSDERILRAVKFVNEHLDEPLTLKQVAAVAYLSPSRFRHLFAAQTGMGLRQYILWRRLVRVWDLRMRGVSLSEAAHTAGFADSAHLARTSRRMMGLPPSLHDVSPPAQT